MSHYSGARHRNIADGTEAVILSVTGTLTYRIVPYGTARCVMTVEDIVDIKTENHLLDSQLLQLFKAIKSAQLLLE